MAGTATTFAGIHNENEFYSHHYLSEIFTGDIRDTVARWRDAAEAAGGAIRLRVRMETCGIGVFLPHGAEIAGIYGEGTPVKVLIPLVGVRGFEPPTPASRRQCSTRLSYTPCCAPPSERGRGVSSCG